jgi:lipopolysaccharide export system ATP-binding protein
MSPQKTSSLLLKEGSAGLRVENLRKSYKSKSILRDINLTLSRGEVVALLGPNGAGKTRR